MYSIDIPTEYYIIDLRKPLVSHQLKIVQGVFIKGSYVASGKNLETIHVSSSELFDKDAIIRCFSTNGGYVEYRVSDMCPFPFGSDDLV